MHFTNNLSWSKHTKQAAIQAQKVLVSTIKYIKVLGNITHRSFFKIFDVKIEPILLYGSEVWGLQHFDVIEKVHLYACKRYLGVKTNTSSVMVYGECDRFPLYKYSYIKVIKYWLRLLNMPVYRIPKKCYNMMIIYDRNGKRNLVTDVRELLFKAGYGQVWYDQNVPSQSVFIMSLTQRLKDIYMQTWSETMSLSSKCFYYRQLKFQISTENYLSQVNIKKFRVALSRFR